MSGGAVPARGGGAQQSDVAEALSRAAHDLNNLCASLIGFAALTQESLEPVSPVQPYLSEIQHATAQMVALSQRLRQLSDQMTGAADR